MAERLHEIECCICHDHYNSGIRKPVMLVPCGHNVCLESFNALVAQAQLDHKILTCPVCRQIVTGHGINRSLMNATADSLAAQEKDRKENERLKRQLAEDAEKSRMEKERLERQRAEDAEKNKRLEEELKKTKMEKQQEQGAKKRAEEPKKEYEIRPETVRIENLPLTVTPQDVENLVSPHGRIAPNSKGEIKIIKKTNQKTGIPDGDWAITFMNESSAKNVINQLNGTSYPGAEKKLLLVHESYKKRTTGSAQQPNADMAAPSGGYPQAGARGGQGNGQASGSPGNWQAPSGGYPQAGARGGQGYGQASGSPGNWQGPNQNSASIPGGSSAQRGGRGHVSGPRGGWQAQTHNNNAPTADGQQSARGGGRGNGQNGYRGNYRGNGGRGRGGSNQGNYNQRGGRGGFEQQ